MNARFEDIWVYLSATPLLGLTITLIAYQFAYWIYSRARFHPLLNPVALSVAMLAALLTLTKTPYQTYFSGAQFIHFLLGPATVALALPLYAQFARLKAEWRQLLIALVAGSLTATVSAVAIAWVLGAKKATLLSLAPKSVTTPIAMGIAEKIGGLPSLTAAAVIATGILGSMIVTPLFNAFGLTDWRARGFAAGVAAHGIGTARAFQVNEVAGAFAGVALALNGLVTALLVPLLVGLLR